MASFGLSLAKRMLQLKFWGSGNCALTARPYRAFEQEKRSLNVIFNTALGFHSWGVTLTQTWPPHDEGGFALAPLTRG